MGMSLPKNGFWVASDTSACDRQPDPDRADTLTACLKRPRLRKPSFCGTDWDGRLLILITTRANHDGEVTIGCRRMEGISLRMIYSVE
jgi:hypothetical protein